MRLGTRLVLSAQINTKFDVRRESNALKNKRTYNYAIFLSIK